MYEKSFQRSTIFFKLSPEMQWEIDKELGILDWSSDDLTKEEIEKFNNHYTL